MNLNLLFETGEITFDIESPYGAEWTLSASGDYAILPETGELLYKTGYSELAKEIKLLTAADVSIANLEIGLAGKGKIDGPGVRGDREIFMEFHQMAPFTIYSLANNHVRDAGVDELCKTLEQFALEKLLYVGAGINESEAEMPRFLEVKGIKLGILSFAQNENQIADRTTPGAAELLADKVLVAAKKLVGQCDVPIIIMHEGYEFMNFPRIPFRNLCRELARIGIKLIIGHHSHVPQGIEKIGDSVIFYSLGNFLFGQQHFAAYSWTRQSFIPVISFKGRTISRIELRPLTIEIDPLCVRPASQEENVLLLKHLKTCSEIIPCDFLMQDAANEFYTNILLPEFFGFLQQYGNRHGGDFSALIERFRTQVTVHKLFEDFLMLFAKNEQLLK
jgi:poly-gamma-glutamate synthesis protein (capsule biosynthesis protein)